jgi:hypothetical protein
MTIVFGRENIKGKDFQSKRFRNHYPDFITKTKSGKTIILETKETRSKEQKFG